MPLAILSQTNKSKRSCYPTSLLTFIPWLVRTSGGTLHHPFSSFLLFYLQPLHCFSLLDAFEAFTPCSSLFSHFYGIIQYFLPTLHSPSVPHPPLAFSSSLFPPLPSWPISIPIQPLFPPGLHSTLVYCSPLSSFPHIFCPCLCLIISDRPKPSLHNLPYYLSTM